MTHTLLSQIRRVTIVSVALCIWCATVPQRVTWAQSEPPPLPDAASPTEIALNAAPPLGEITAQMRKDDPRLNAPVAFSSPRATVRQLSDALGATAKVTLRIGESARAPRPIDARFASGEAVVCAFLPEMPLADALNALVALLSYDKARWTWERVKNENGDYAYELTPPRTRLSAYALTVRSQIQGEYESNALQSGAFIAPSSEASAQSNTEKSRSRPNVEALTSKACLDVFREALTREERISVLQGQRRIVTVEPLTPLWRLLDQANRERFGTMATWEGSETPKPRPVMIWFLPNSDKYYLCPRLTVNLAIGPVIGCDENAWNERLNRAWAGTPPRRERRAASVSEAEERIVKSVAAPLPKTKGDDKDSDEKQPDMVVDAEEAALWRLGEGAMLPILALLPPRHDSKLGVWKDSDWPSATGIVITSPGEKWLFNNDSFLVTKDARGNEKRVPLPYKAAGGKSTSTSTFSSEHPLLKSLSGKTVGEVLTGLQEWPTGLRRKWSGDPDRPILLLRDPVAPFRTDGGEWTLPSGH